MADTSDWIKKDFLQFENQNFGDIDLTNCKALPNQYNFDFNTELRFINCKIKTFNIATAVVGKQITFKDCSIGYLQCYATYFCGGLSLTNSTLGGAQFDCGVHNIDPHTFIISNCRFDNFVGFFDVYFEGPVIIAENNFIGGTNIQLYLGVPYGIKAGIPYLLDNNKGQLDKLDGN
jgi:hypothetical protein